MRTPANFDPHLWPVYQFCLKSHIDLYWSDWFAGMTIRHAPHGVTVLTGAVADQAALHGLLNKIRDLGLTLLELRLMPASCSDDVNEVDS